MTETSNAPTTLASRELPSEMLYEIPRDPAPSGLPSTDRAPADSAPAEGSTNPVALSSRRRRLDTQTVRHEILDQSKHSISPSALAAALEECSDVVSSDTGDSDLKIALEEALRRYKRARIDETTARLEGRSVLPEGDSSSGYREEAAKLALIEANENSYWAGAFGQNETQSFKVVTEGTSHSARRLLFEYGRRNVRCAHKTISSSHTVDANAFTTLPHRPRNSEAESDASIATDMASEDEGFAMVHKSQATADPTPHSPMSSPELVPTASIAQTMSDDKTASDDDWTML